MSNSCLKILGLLLDYPQQAWLSLGPTLRDQLRKETAFSTVTQAGLDRLMDELYSEELAAQEAYVETFDRTRSLSLHLFEHVHGDGKERGEAMLDLIELYAKEEVEIEGNELPDYLPIFLEYCSRLDNAAARDNLANIAPIVKALGQRLLTAQSPYVAVFNAILNWIGEVELTAGHTLIRPPETTFADIDREWEERRVEFLGAQLQSTDAPQSALGAKCI
jgi:nitrate reductase delta subunit